MSKKGHLTFKKRALNIWSGVRLHPMHPMHPVKYTTGSLFFMHFCIVGSPFLRCLKFSSGCFRQVFFHLGDKKKWWLVALGRWSFYTVTIVWEFALMDLASVVLDEWSSYRGGPLNRFDCNWCLTNPNKLIFSILVSIG